jgi:cephalosporin-C deacetylase
MFHGYSGSAGDWHDKLAYTSAGMAVMALDARGQGGLSEDIEPRTGTTLNGHIIRGLNDSPDKLAFRSIFLDCAQMARVASGLPEIDAGRLGAVGGSQGGGLTVACSALVPSVKALAPRCPFLSDYKRVWEMDLAKDAYDELKRFFRNHDPLHKRETEIFTRLGYIDIQNLAPRVKGRVLWGIGLMDNICPPSTQFAAYNKITSQKELAVYPDFAHEGYPGFDDRALMFFAENL